MKTGTTEYHKFWSAMHANLLFEAVDPLLRSHLIMHPDYRDLVHPAKQHKWNVEKILAALSVLELEPAYAQSKRAKDNEAAARNKAAKVQNNAIAALEAQVQVFATQMSQHRPAQKRKVLQVRQRLSTAAGQPAAPNTAQGQVRLPLQKQNLSRKP